MQKPLLHFSNQLCKILRIRLHDLVKLGELSWPKEDFRHSELELILAQTKCFEQSLKSIYTAANSVEITLHMSNDSS